jgi:hypothetical protein
MIPRSQHFGDRAPFPHLRSGIMRVFEEPASKLSSSPLVAAPITPGAAECKHRGGRSPPSRRPKAHSLRWIRQDRPRLEQALVYAFEAAAEDRDARAAASSRTSACVSGLPAESSPASAPPAASRAHDRPPERARPPHHHPCPAARGVSSTERCLSWRSRVSARSPATSALRQGPSPPGYGAAAPGNISGKSVRTVAAKVTGSGVTGLSAAPVCPADWSAASRTSPLIRPRSHFHWKLPARAPVAVIGARSVAMPTIDLRRRTPSPQFSADLGPHQEFMARSLLEDRDCPPNTFRPRRDRQLPGFG